MEEFGKSGKREIHSVIIYSLKRQWANVSFGDRGLSLSGK